MNAGYLLFARRGDPNSPINKWLGENPLVLGLILAALGGILLASGIREMKKGVAHDKYGNQFGGGMALFMSSVRIIGGIGFGGFGVYKMIFG